MKRLTIDNKMAAYDDAINALRAMESDSDGPGDKDARFWLAAKLDKEADRMVVRATPNGKERG